MTDFDNTPVSQERASGDKKSVSYYVEVEWGENGIGEIAHQAGLEEIYYADLKAVRVLGYWEQSFVRVYGRPAIKPATQLGASGVE